MVCLGKLEFYAEQVTGEVSGGKRVSKQQFSRAINVLSAIEK
jgi:hypothetical protein